MSKLDMLKVTRLNTVKELRTLENYARENEENYEHTVNRINCEGYIDGLDYAIALLQNEVN
jgi:hypothetical protein